MGLTFKIPDHGADPDPALVEFLSTLPDKLWEGDDSGLRIGELFLLPGDVLFVEEYEITQKFQIYGHVNQSGLVGVEERELDG